MWGYPITPLLFIGITALVPRQHLLTRPVPALAGLALIVAGFPVFYIWGRRRA